MPPRAFYGAGMHESRTVATQRTLWRLGLSALLLSGAAFACVVSDALTGPEVASVVLRYTGDSVLVQGDSIPFALSAEFDGAPVTGARFGFTIEDSSIVSPTPRGDFLVGRRRGATRLSAALASPLLTNPPSLTVTLNVVVGSVSVIPSLDTLRSLDDTLLLSAPAFDARGL